jgi:hypothetical protein
MTVYRVLRASIYRRSGILIVKIEESNDRDGPDFEIDGQPEKKLRFRLGRVVFDGDTLSNKRILVIEPPEFPVEELVGRRILSKR